MKSDIKQFEFVDRDLRALALWLEHSTGLEFTQTSLYRMGDEGVHGTLPLCGIDLRCRNRVIGEAIALHTNKNWVYDHTRPQMKCAVLHGEGANLHLHIQTHPNTTSLLK